MKESVEGKVDENQIKEAIYIKKGKSAIGFYVNMYSDTL